MAIDRYEDEAVIPVVPRHMDFRNKRVLLGIFMQNINLHKFIIITIIVLL
jgi:hypothetical protein